MQEDAQEYLSFLLNKLHAELTIGIVAILHSQIPVDLSYINVLTHYSVFLLSFEYWSILSFNLN